MAIRARIDRHKCVGAGNCITLAPTAFDWLAGDYGKSDVVGRGQRRRGAPARRGLLVPDRRHDPRGRLRAPAVAAARQGGPRPAGHADVHVHGHRRLDDPRRGARRRGMGDDARWHNTALREVFAAHSGEEISTTGDGFFVSFDSPDLAVTAAIAIQRRLAEHRATQGFAPAGADRPACVRCDAGRRRLPRQGRSRGVADRGPRRGRRHRRQRRDGRRVASDVRSAERRRSEGLSGPIEVVNVEWR